MKFGELVENLEKSDIEDVFVERRIINREIFDEIEETFGNVSVAAILIEIINSGKDAMLSLIDILFLKEQCSLAQGFLESASADRGMHDVNDMTGEYTISKCKRDRISWLIRTPEKGCYF